MAEGSVPLFRTVIFGLGACLVFGCGTGLSTDRNENEGEPQEVELLPGDAQICLEGCDAGEIEISPDGRGASLAISGSQIVGACANTATDLAFTTATRVLSGVFAPPMRIHVTGIDFSLEKIGAPPGSLLLEIREGGAGQPPAGLIATAGMQLLSSVPTPGAQWVHFPLPTPYPVIPSGKSFHSVLSTSGYTYAMGYEFSAKKTTGCGGEFLGAATMDGGAWSYPTQVNLQVHAATFSGAQPTLTYLYDAGETVDWDMTSFHPSENQQGEEGGVDYELQVLSSSESDFQGDFEPADSIQARTGLWRGRYLHLRARLNTSNGGLSDAHLGPIRLQYREILE